MITFVTAVKDDEVSRRGANAISFQREWRLIFPAFVGGSVLGLRRVRRSEPARRVGGPQSRAEGAWTEQPLSNGGHAHVKVRSRKRPTNDNARMGEGKIGRAAQLRPGRISFKIIDETIPNPRGRNSPVEPASHASNTIESIDAPVKDTEAESSWNSEEHSQHSNRLYRQAKVPRKDPPHNRITEHYLNDFYTRNPAAKANGWLSLPHHRHLPAISTGDHSPAVDHAARGTIQSQTRQVLGLLPNLKRRRKHR